MSIELKVPVLPESVTDATVSTWHKKEGEFVKRDENIVDVETDKVMLEVPAPEDGIIKEIKKPEGSVVGAEEVIAIFEPGAAPAGDAPSEDAPAEAKAESEAQAAEPQAQTTAPKAAPTEADKAGVAGPSARRAGAEHGVDTGAMAGSGKDGRVTKMDVLQQAARGGTGAAPVGRTEERVPMTRLRQRIAERLLSAQQQAAILTTFNEVNLKPVADIRKKYKDKFQDKHGIKLGFMSFFVKAAVEALKRFPDVNASIDGNDIVYHNYFDIGVAVSTPRGLMVPIIRDVDNMSLADIEKAIMEYSVKARENKISVEDMTGGTFTVSNGGVFGSLLSTPILNPPQSAILGMHKIEERPVVENGEIVIRPMMYLAMSYDHRIIDGKESVTFLRTIKEILEDPNVLLLDL
jgi:2-oxoglutarate dehydrogenase E2 component (dihydrolipoamide succinyltransferase)